MNKLFIKTISLTAIATTLFALTTTKSQAQVNFSPAKSRYARGECITLTARSWFPNTWVTFQQTSTHDFYAHVGYAYAGWDCVARLGSYIVPTDPNRDNVVISACDTFKGHFYGDKRIPIGR